MGALEAIKTMIDDYGDKGGPGFRQDFADDKPYRSFLQRCDKDLDEVLKMLDWKDDDALWQKEYDGDEKDSEKMERYRRRIFFLICSWREMKEDFGRGDVSCLRELRTPMVTSRSPMRSMKDEFEEAPNG